MSALGGVLISLNSLDSCLLLLGCHHLYPRCSFCHHSCCYHAHPHRLHCHLAVSHLHWAPIASPRYCRPCVYLLIWYWPLGLYHNRPLPRRILALHHSQLIHGSCRHASNQFTGSSVHRRSQTARSAPNPCSDICR